MDESPPEVLQAPFELFHMFTNASSARVCRFIVDHGLEAEVRFRNLSFPEVEEALRAHGGTVPPALWDGERLVEGAEAIFSRLNAHSDVGRSG